MKAGRAHAAIAALHTGFESEIASAGIQIHKQNGGIRLATAEPLVFTHIRRASIHKVDWLTGIRLGNIQDQGFSVFQLRLELGKTMLPVESR